MGRKGPSHKRRRTCLDKKRFPTEEKAWEVITKAKYDLRAYRCPYCHGWHLTKRTDRTR